MLARRIPLGIVGVLATAALVSAGAISSASAAPGQVGGVSGGHHTRISHVLLISVDGMHQQTSPGT